MAAKQPTISQVEQLVQDLKATERSSQIPAVQEQAKKTLAAAVPFLEEFRTYRRLTF